MDCGADLLSRLLLSLFCVTFGFRTIYGSEEIALSSVQKHYRFPSIVCPWMFVIKSTTQVGELL